jgi:redox-sensing transcriptional repressor
MATVSDIPDIVIGRLPIYLRALNQLAQQGQSITSSHELGQRLGISSPRSAKICPTLASSGSRHRLPDQPFASSTQANLAG